MKLLSTIKKININKLYNFNNYINLKHFPSAVRYWDNSIYYFNKNTISLIPNTSKLAIKLIREYFYLFNKKIEKKIRKKQLWNRFRKISKNRIFISKGEFKHTNNKVIITLYVYNRQKNNYLTKLKNIYINKFLTSLFSLKKARLNNNNKLFRKIILLKKLEKMNSKGLLTLIKAHRFKPRISFILRELYKKKDIYKYKAVHKYINKFYKKLIKKSLKRLLIYIYYRQLIYINKSKFNYTYLQIIKNKLETLFNKNIEFNFINLNNFYLNSNILTESILLKIQKNRRKLLKYLSLLKKKVKIRKKRVILGKESKVIKPNIKNYFNNQNLLQKHIIRTLKYRHITGFRLEAKGRLNRRHTASRSLSKLQYKGNLMNIDSSYVGSSSVLLRSNLNTNLQYTKLSSKTRVGSFGLKGWVSGN
jgi:hypothetical protein